MLQNDFEPERRKLLPDLGRTAGALNSKIQPFRAQRRCTDHGSGRLAYKRGKQRTHSTVSASISAGQSSFVGSGRVLSLLLQCTLYFRHKNCLKTMGPACPDGFQRKCYDSCGSGPGLQPVAGHLTTAVRLAPADLVVRWRRWSLASQRRRVSYLRAGKNPFLPPRPYWKDYCREEDEDLAKELFLGRTVGDKTRRAKKEYPPQDSARERSAREALIRLLGYCWRDESFVIAALLSEALEIDGEGERRLVFQFRKKGKRPNLSADFAVAFHVLIKKDDTPTKSAVYDAMDKFGLSRKAVFDCIKRVKEFLGSCGVNAF